MKKLLCLMGGAILLSHLWAQQISPLHLGEIFPGAKVDIITNHKNTSEELSNFSDKLLIIDFMNTGCSGCISALPKMDSISRLFTPNIALFVSTPENSDKVNAFRNHNIIGKSISLPFIVNDSLLERYFPHEFISHVVWIYKGKLVAITHSDYVTEKNVETILSGQPINWPVKRDIINYDYSTPLITLNNNFIPEFSLPEINQYTAFLSHMDNITPRYTAIYDSISNTTRITAVNLSIYQLYLKAFGLSPQFELSHVFTNKRIAELLTNSYGNVVKSEWESKNTLCYETQSNGTQKCVEKKLKSDFNHHFKLQTYLKDSLVNCWVLKYDSSLQEKNFDKFKNHMEAVKANEIDIRGVIYKMNHTLFHIPVVGIKGFGSKKYMKIETEDFNDLSKVNSLIAPYGLSFKKTQKRLPVLIIKN